MGRKTEDRASPNRKTAKKQGKKTFLRERSCVSYNQKNLTLIAMQLLELIDYLMGLILSEHKNKVVMIPKLLTKMSVEYAKSHSKRP
jgi:hypothetical protein